MKVRLGDKIESVNFGGGTIVAMTKQWCIFKSSHMEDEVAVPWNEVYIPVEPGDSHMEAEKRALNLLKDLNTLHDKWDAKGSKSGSDDYEDALYTCINELGDVIIKYEKV